MTSSGIGVWQPGDVIDGRYELVKLIGAGGMGAVWRVFHREWNRELALKMPLAELMGIPALRERFVREAETWIGLGVHPHIVQCWFVADIGGVPSLFLDFLTGGSLKGWMEQGYLAPGRWDLILDVAMQVTEGLAHAHSRGVVHRDVKPENLLIRGDERVCVTDFGIVKTATADVQTNSLGRGTEAPRALGVTGVGAFLGTPQYGAPEQWGAAERVGPQADIYALGITLYEMCCGRRPFDVEGEELSIETLIDRHLHVPAPDPRSFFPGIPEELAHLCLVLLEKDPARRPASMLALRKVLASIYHHLTGKTCAPPTPLLEDVSPEVLNNQAVSLHSLGMTRQAAQTLRRGLRLESAHPECLFNLVQLDKQHERIDALEGLRRLRQSKADYPLALMLIAEGQASEALTILQGLCRDSKAPGPVLRALGDAYMYEEQFSEAFGAYTRALECMPKDTAAAERRVLASAGCRENDRGIFFPQNRPRAIDRSADPEIFLMLDDIGRGLMGLSDGVALYLNLSTLASEGEESRAPEGAAPGRAWVAGKRLLVADRQGFEFRLVPSMRCLARKRGRVLACSPSIDRVVTLEDTGPYLFQVEKGVFNPISMKGQSPNQGPLLAAFDPEGGALCFLLPSGQLAGLDEANRAVPQPWPARVEGHQHATCLGLSGDGLVLVGLGHGEVLGLHVVDRREEFRFRLPEAPLSFEMLARDTHVLLRTANGYGVLNRRGELIFSGRGPVAVVAGGEHLLFFVGGYLHQYRVCPWHLERHWSRQLKSPRSLTVSRDGRLAVSLDHGGEYQVWEVDEAHRVYQRDLLLSLGRGYAEIVSDVEQFREAMSLAHDSCARGDELAAYRYLLRARKVRGYGQGDQALDLGWELLDKLTREGLEAVWERLSIEGRPPGPVDLDPRVRCLLWATGKTVTFGLDEGGAAGVRWVFDCDSRVVCLHYFADTASPFVVAADGGGTVYILNVDSGQCLTRVKLPTKALQTAHIEGENLIFYGEDGPLGLFHLADSSVLCREDCPGRVQAVGHWANDRILVATSNSFGFLELRRPRSPLRGIPTGGNTLVQPPCFIRHLIAYGALVLGFADGGLLILDSTGKRTLAAFDHEGDGAITGFELVPRLALAVTATSNGTMYFWDIRQGRLLEKFLAHRGGLLYLRAGSYGRYLFSSGADGWVRLWETSWLAGGLATNLGTNSLPWLKGIEGGRKPVSTSLFSSLRKLGG